ncbi:MAG: flagellar basal body-associated FliL family protein [Dehalococcoidales bacterium]|nr:flagellar basal body-associated FliL family protein [Dehalococcoidales bacterium]
MKKLFSGKMVIVLVAIVALLGGASAGLFILPQFSPAAARSTSEPAHAKESAPEPGMMFPLKERVVNLADPGAYHYLKIEIILEFEDPDAKGLKGEAYKKRQDEFAKEMTSRRPIMDDIVTTTLAGKTSAALSSAEGKEKLREELKTKLGQVAGEHKLLNVYFTQLLIQ